jgi:hypothetical protein
MLLRISLAAFAAAISLGLWSEACAGGHDATALTSDTLAARCLLT